MTNEELNALDAEIHAKVFGHMDPHRQPWVKNYSTDISDAWEVVEAMNRLGFRLRLTTWPDSIASGAHVEFWTLDKYDCWHAAEATPAIAICKAALWAVDQHACVGANL